MRAVRVCVWTQHNHESCPTLSTTIVESMVFLSMVDFLGQKKGKKSVEDISISCPDIDSFVLASFPLRERWAGGGGEGEGGEKSLRR